MTLKTSVETHGSLTDALAGDGSFSAYATIVHDGQSYTSGAGYVSSDLIIAYAVDGQIVTFDGTVLGPYRVTSRWTRYSRYGPYRMAAIRARIAGRYWYARYGSDWSQLVRLRPAKHQ